MIDYMFLFVKLGIWELEGSCFDMLSMNEGGGRGFIAEGAEIAEGEEGVAGQSRGRDCGWLNGSR